MWHCVGSATFTTVCSLTSQYYTITLQDFGQSPTLKKPETKPKPFSLMNETSTFTLQHDMLQLKKSTFWFTESGQWQTMPFYFAPSLLSDSLKLVLQFRRG